MLKFNAIVGNPPYQIMDGGTQTSATPVYHVFVDVAKALKPNYVSLIMPARWYGGGKGLDQFRDRMISDKHIVQLHDFINSTECFSNVEIKGGLCYFLRDSNHESKCRIFTHNGGVTEQSPRYLKEDGCDVFIRFEIAIGIMKKVSQSLTESFENLVSSQKPFGLRTFVHGKTKPFANSIRVYENGGVGYISRGEVEKNEQWIDCHKIYISRAYNAGDGFPHQIIGKPIYGAPETCCTETYVMLGPFPSELACLNVEKYIRTKFFRFMVMLKKASQQVPSTVFTYVPQFDFENNSDINWSNSVDAINRDLYAKYNLSGTEIEFIESMIKPM